MSPRARQSLLRPSRKMPGIQHTSASPWLMRKQRETQQHENSSCCHCDGLEKRRQGK
jgi:hypothetical protein